MRIGIFLYKILKITKYSQVMTLLPYTTVVQPSTLVEETSNIRGFKVKLSSVDEKLTWLSLTQHENNLQSTQQNISAFETPEHESITAFIKEERLRFDKGINLCTFNLQQTSDDLS